MQFGVEAAPNEGRCYLTELWVQSGGETARIAECGYLTVLWVQSRVDTAPEWTLCGREIYFSRLLNFLYVLIDHVKFLQACPQADSVNQLDVITREVVRCWSLEKDCTRIKARKLCNVAKQPDSLSESSFFTLDHSRISQWDIRVPRGIVEEYDAMKYVCGSQYASKQRFQCIAVDGDGDVALGSEDGVISLYSAGVLSRAKVKLPKLKGSIRNLDVTYSGNLLLATLDHELVLMCTSFNDKEGRLKSAFKSTGLKGSTTTTPILLRLKAIDASIFLTGHTLHDGRFSWVSIIGCKIGIYSVVLFRVVTYCASCYMADWRQERVLHCG